VKLHLDTDLGSDTDDACALAMLLGWPEVELTGITTVIDPGGRRAGYVARCLELAGREGIPVAAGAAVSMTTGTMPGDIPSEPRYWVVVTAADHLTLVTLAATAQVHLRGAHLGRLQATGPLGRLLARQARAHGADNALSSLGRQYQGLPDDLLNFQHDALAGAVAVGWGGVTADPVGLVPVNDLGVLRFRIDPAGRPATVVLDADGPMFEPMWLQRVESIVVPSTRRV
jgi:hypothetical protein